MSTPLRVVLDTNVVLSALVFGGGAAGRVRLAWQRGAIVPLVCIATVQELVRAMGYSKFRLSGQEQEELLADYLPYAKVVRIPSPPPAVPQCRDPMDVPFLHLAVAGKARVLASGDQDVLALGGTIERARSWQIVSLDAFAQSYLFPLEDHSPKRVKEFDAAEAALAAVTAGRSRARRVDS